MFFPTFQHSSLPMTEESLDDLSEIVGPELANLVNCGGGGGGGGAARAAAAAAAAAAAGGGNSLVTLQPVVKTAAASSTAGHQQHEGGGDLSDLKSSDLIQTLSAVIDIDKMFADFHQSTDGAGSHHHRQDQQQASIIFFNLVNISKQ